jgi:hypothetical protein
VNEDNAISSDGGQRAARFALGLAVGALAGYTIARRVAAPRRMPYVALWRQALAEKRGEAEAARLVARAQARYHNLYTQRARPARRALRFHLERSILPGLALYETLLEEGDDREAALSEMEHLTTSTLSRLRRLVPLLGRVPDPFAVFRRATPWVVRLGFPPEGWGMESVEDSDDCIAFNVHRCFYLDTLASYGAPELTPVFCGGDDTLFGALPQAITWERTTTLGRGHDRCDFRWRRGESSSQP